MINLIKIWSKFMIFGDNLSKYLPNKVKLIENDEES